MKCRICRSAEVEKHELVCDSCARKQRELEEIEDRINEESG